MALGRVSLLSLLHVWLPPPPPPLVFQSPDCCGSVRKDQFSSSELNSIVFSTSVALLNFTQNSKGQTGLS